MDGQDLYEVLCALASQENKDGKRYASLPSISYQLFRIANQLERIANIKAADFIAHGGKEPPVGSADTYRYYVRELPKEW